MPVKTVQKAKTGSEGCHKNKATPSKRKMKATARAFISVSDFLMSFLIVSTFVVFFWRGSWQIIDLYLFPGNLELNYWTSFVIGNLVLIASGLFQKYLGMIKEVKNPILYFILSRTYLYILSFGNVAQWHGTWNLQDFYTKPTWQSASSSLAIGLGALCCLRSASSVITAPPLTIGHDSDQIKFFTMTGRLQSKVGCNFRFLVDMIMTPLVIHTLLVTFWRGLWTLMNIYLFPEENVLSGLFSLVASLGLAYPAIISKDFILYLVKSGKKKKPNIFHTLVLYVYLIVASAVPVGHWRGIWLLQDSWLIPENKTVSVWTSHVIGFIGSVLVLAGKSIPVTGCSLDRHIVHNNQPLIKINYFKNFWENICLSNHDNTYNVKSESMESKQKEISDNVFEFTYITHL